MKGKDKLATIEDVARRAEVAIGTVSRYLNGHSVRKGNRQKIEEAIKALSYSTNVAARTMKTNKTYTIGVILSGFDGFSSTVLAGLTRHFKQAGYAVVTFHHEDDPEILDEVFRFLSSRQVDGIVFAGGADAASHIDTVLSFGKPVVLYNNDIEALELDRVLVNDYETSRKAVEYFLHLGHRKVGIITGSLTTSTGRNRLEGFRAAFRSFNLEPPEQYVIEGRWHSRDGYSGTHNLMERDDPPTAIFFSNYRLALGGIEALQERKISIPNGVSLITFDDMDFFRLLNPPLTAIAQPAPDIAEALTEMMINRLNGEYTGPPRKIILPCSFIIRNSVAPRFESHENCII